MFPALLALASLTAPPIDIRDFGAIGDGETMCTHAIQQALDEAGHRGSGIVDIPSGRYLTGSLHLRSHVELRLERNAVLLGSPHRSDYEKGLWYALLLGLNVEGVTISGSGTIDGQGAELAKDVLHLVELGQVKIPLKGWRPSELDRPQILEINNCFHVRVRGVSIVHSCCWVQTYRECGDIVLDGVHVDSKTYWNNDGIDVVDCRNVKIINCDIDSGDDGICLKSDGRNTSCEDIKIENCRVRSSASAIKFGTSSHGGFRRVSIRHIDIRDTFRSAVALESVDGGTLEDIDVSNIRAVHTGNAFFIRLGHRASSVPPGVVRHIVLRDFDVQVPAGRPDFGYPFKGPQFSEPHNIEPSSIVGLPQAPVMDVKLDRIKIRMPGGGSAAIAKVAGKVPERAKEYPEFTMFGELPAWALYVRHVRGLKIHDFTVTLDKPDYRPAFAMDDAEHVTIRKAKVLGPGRKGPIPLDPRTSPQRQAPRETRR